MEISAIPLTTPPPRPPRGFASIAAKFLVRLVFFGTAIGLAATATAVFADLLWRTYGTFTGAMIVLTVLFATLFGLVSLGFSHALFGFLTLPFRKLRALNIGARLAPADLNVPLRPHRHRLPDLQRGGRARLCRPARRLPLARALRPPRATSTSSS